MKKLMATVVVGTLFLTGCAEREPEALPRICVLQESGRQVEDRRCEGAGEPGVTAWMWVQQEIEVDFDDGHGVSKHKVTKGTYIQPPKTTTRRR